MNKTFKFLVVSSVAAISAISLASCGSNKKRSAELLAAISRFSENVEKLPTYADLLGETNSSSKIQKRSIPLRKDEGGKPDYEIPTNYELTFDLLSTPSNVNYSGYFADNYMHQDQFDLMITGARLLKDYVESLVYNIDTWTDCWGSGIHHNAKVKMLVDNESDKVTCYSIEDDGYRSMNEVVTYTNENGNSVVEYSKIITEMENKISEDGNKYTLTYVENEYVIYTEYNKVYYSDLSTTQSNIYIIEASMGYKNGVLSPIGIYNFKAIVQDESGYYHQYRNEYQPNTSSPFYSLFSNDKILVAEIGSSMNGSRINATYLNEITSGTLYYNDDFHHNFYGPIFNGTAIIKNSNDERIYDAKIDYYYKKPYSTWYFYNGNDPKISEIIGYYPIIELGTNTEQGSTFNELVNFVGYTFKDLQVPTMIDHEMNNLETTFANMSAGKVTSFDTFTNTKWNLLQSSAHENTLTKEMHDRFYDEPTVDYQGR